MPCLRKPMLVQSSSKNNALCWIPRSLFVSSMSSTARFTRALPGAGKARSVVQGLCSQTGMNKKHIQTSPDLGFRILQSWQMRCATILFATVGAQPFSLCKSIAPDTESGRHFLLTPPFSCLCSVGPVGNDAGFWE